MIHLRNFNSYSDQEEINIEDWLENILQEHPLHDVAILRHALTLAQLAGSEQATPYGISCFLQGLAMAETLNTLYVDTETLVAAIVYNSVQYADLSLEDIEEHFGPNVKKLIQLTTQMEGISELYESVAYHEHHHPKIDNIRKMLLAMVDDFRVVLIKITEQLFILRNAKMLPREQQQQIAQQAMAIYAPLANRLGIGNLKWELEDLAFRYLQPEKYKQISDDLKQRRVDREQDVQKIIALLHSLLEKNDIKDIEISGRAKHIYSIYRKMQRKHVDFKEIYDATALRVIVPTVEDCYTVLSNVHATWEHVPKEFDDYIATPKKNGYQSIHTAIIGPGNKNVEIQIRTKKMHEEAELGVAAHWVYKEGPQKSSDYEAKISWLRQVMDWQKEVTGSEDVLDEIHNIFDDRVYVFTPNNEIIDLPKGATVLDFAYQIHSEVGHRCRGAKVDNNIVNLTYQPKTGEHIEILTTKQPKPSRDWLNPHLQFLKTSRAKAKIHHWFKKQDYEKNIALGQDLLDKEFRRLGLKNINISNLANKLKIKNTDDLYAALASGDIKIGSVVNFIQRELEKPDKAAEVPAITPPVTQKRPTDIDIQGVDNLLTNIANCCHPLPGDPIVGYITQGRGVSIHRKDCFNILHAKKNKSERLVEVNWGTGATNYYPTNLIIEAYNRPGLVKDISAIISNENIDLVGLNFNVNKKDNIAYVNLTVEIQSLASLDRIAAKIKQLSNVVAVKRSH